MFGNEPFEEDDGIIKINNKSGRKHVDDGSDFIKIDSRIRPMSEDRRQQLLEMYGKVVVHDFNDTYHMTDAEREQFDTNYKMKVLVQKQKTKYSDINRFIAAWKNCLTVLNYIAENNGIFSNDAFTKKVLTNKIKVTGLVFPRYNRKKNSPLYNWDYISELIMSDDPDAAVQMLDDDRGRYDDEDRETYLRRIFGDTEYEYLVVNNELPPEYQEEYDDIDQESEPITSKKLSKFNESGSIIVNAIKQLHKDRHNESKLDEFAWSLSADDFEAIAEFDRRRGIDVTNMPKFKGDIMNKDDYERYLYRLYEWELNNTYVRHDNKTRKLADAQELELKEVLEHNNWNIRNLYRGERKDKEKNSKKELKRLRNREDKTKARLLGCSIDEIRSKKEEKEDKKKKKKGEKFNDNFKKSKKSTMEELVMESLSLTGDDFGEYSKEMSDMSWKNITDD